MILIIITTLLGTIIALRLMNEVRSFIRLKKYKKQGIKCEYFPLIGNFIELIKNQDKNDQLAFTKQKLYNETADLIVKNHLSGRAMIFLNSPQAVKEFASVELQVSQKQKIIDIDIFGFTFKSGEEVTKSRRIFMKLFHRENLGAMCPQMSKIVLKHIESLKQKIKGSEKKKIILELRTEFLKNLIEDIASYVLLGVEQKSELSPLPSGQNVIEAVNTMTKKWVSCILSLGNMFTGGKIFSWNLSPTKKEILEINNELIDYGINEYNKRSSEEKKDHSDFLSLIIDHNNEMEKNGTPEEMMPLKEIGENFGLFLLAGSDTSAQVSINLLCQLAENPNSQQKLFSELEVLKKNPSVLSTDTLDSLEYLDCCFKESMRHMPPLFNSAGRYLVKDLKICGKKLYKGDFVIYNMLSTAQREKEHKNSKNFEPERFSKERKRDFVKFSSNPFVAGPRNCVGQYLGEIMTKLIVGHFVKEFEIKKVEEFQRYIITLYAVKNPKVEVGLRDC